MVVRRLSPRPKDRKRSVAWTPPPTEKLVFGAFDSLTAHDDLITETQIGDGLDLAMFTTGYGDGGYRVYVGLDKDGSPTQYVIDFAVVHLAWPPP